mmetsp:Transcript_42435/g.74383  ORF Transcript_42435/g.74383 Transcript_42435/m.74383 type:complete len:84 (+) Transcript_42435:88-339(+)
MRIKNGAADCSKHGIHHETFPECLHLIFLQILLNVFFFCSPSLTPRYPSSLLVFHTQLTIIRQPMIVQQQAKSSSPEDFSTPP